MNRWESLKFQVKLLHPNFFKSKSHELPDDLILGFMQEPERPFHLPRDAQWLGGLGEGCWFSLTKLVDEVEITRFNYKGEIDYIVRASTDDMLHTFDEAKFSYQVHHNYHVVKLKDQEVVFKTLDINNFKLKKTI